MKNRKCPNHKACWDYGDCENCELGKEITRLHKRIDRLKKQNETLTIQRNAWALATKAVQADTVRKMQEALEYRIHNKLSYHGWYLKETVIAEIAKEMLEDENVTKNN